MMRSHFGYDRFRAWIGFHDGLAHRIEAAADLFFMPSRFEPCGLTQMYSQRYGALPLVRATGGLDDTVENYDPATGRGTSWDLTPDNLVATVAWAVDTYRRRPDHFRAMQRRAMQKHFGWDIAAREYAKVYEWAAQARQGVTAIEVAEGGRRRADFSRPGASREAERMSGCTTTPRPEIRVNTMASARANGNLWRQARRASGVRAG